MQAQVFNISLPIDLVKKMDIAAKREYRNRSELIREAVRVYLKDSQEWEELFSFAQKQSKKFGITKEADIDRIVSSYRKGK